MNIGSNAVVAFDYVLSDGDGEILDRGDGEDAMTYLHGHEQLMPKLESALEGKTVGDRIQVTVPPAEAYGEKTGQDEVRIPRTELPPDAELEAGVELTAEAADGRVETFWVVAVEKDAVVLTRDHPLSGVTLHFDMTITKIRPATEEEIEHGHTHDGHEHHHH